MFKCAASSRSLSTGLVLVQRDGSAWVSRSVALGWLLLLNALVVTPAPADEPPSSTNQAGGNSPSPRGILPFRDPARNGLAAAAILVTGLTWIVVLRKRVATRTASLAAANDRLLREIEEREQVASELRRKDAELRAALEQERELRELKSNFVNVVSHEFRTPLSIILSSSEILGSYYETLSSEERAEHLTDIRDCSRYMAGMIEDVLLLGRAEAGKLHFRPTILNIPDFCQQLIDEVRAATQTKLSINFAAQEVSEQARGDEGLMRHIFQNLLSNAIKYSRPNQFVTFSAQRDGGDVVFVIRDRGIGIPVGDLERIFTSFHRGINVGQLPGSGLGLVVVKRCVDLHDGKIQIDSTEGSGTSVTVRLPLYIKTGHTTTLNRSGNPGHSAT